MRPFTLIPDTRLRDKIVFMRNENICPRILNTNEIKLTDELMKA